MNTQSAEPSPKYSLQAQYEGIMCIEHMPQTTNVYETLSRDELKREWLKTLGRSALARVGSITMTRILYSEQRWRQSDYSKPAFIKKVQSEGFKRMLQRTV